MVKADNLSVTLKSISRGDAGAFAVVIYSSSYAPAMQVLNYVKDYLEKTPSIHLVALSLEDHRQLLSDPLLNVTEVPTVLLFFRGKPFGFRITDIALVGEALRRLAICSMEVDKFESMGTSFYLSSDSPAYKPDVATTTTEASIGSYLFAPIYTLMDSLYDI